QTTQALMTLDATSSASNFRTGLDEPVTKALMVAFPVKMTQEACDGAEQALFTEEYHPVQTFAFHTAEESFQVGTQVGRLGRQAQGLDPCTSEDTAEAVAEFAIAIHEQIALTMQEAIVGINQVARDLLHPGFFGVGRGTSKTDASRGHFHDEQQVDRHEPFLAPDFDGREVDGGQHIPVTLEEGLPGAMSFLHGRWRKAMFLEVFSD